MKILSKEKKYKKPRSFSTIELIVSVSIIVILGGIFLLNYQLQKEKVDLNNAVSSVAQEIRKAQGLTMGQGARPSTCEVSSGEASTNFAVKFDKNYNYVFLYVDKDQANECEVEKRYFPPTIMIGKITPSPDGNTGWISFYRENFKIEINGPGSGVNSLKIDFCIKSDCTLNNTKSIIINNKGMVDIE